MPAFPSSRASSQRDSLNVPVSHPSPTSFGTLPLAIRMDHQCRTLLKVNAHRANPAARVVGHIGRQIGRHDGQLVRARMKLPGHVDPDEIGMTATDSDLGAVKVKGADIVTRKETDCPADLLVRQGCQAFADNSVSRSARREWRRPPDTITSSRRECP